MKVAVTFYFLVLCIFFLKNDEDRSAKSLVPSLNYSGMGTTVHLNMDSDNTIKAEYEAITL
jgi:hypothetical protein